MASSREGTIMMAVLFVGFWRSCSTNGNRKASVLPLPVAENKMRSLCVAVASKAASCIGFNALMLRLLSASVSQPGCCCITAKVGNCLNRDWGRFER